MIDDQTRKHLGAIAARSADHWFVYRLMGFNRRSDDGRRRQRLIRRCKPLQRLNFASAPTRSDPRAVGVVDAGGRLLGFLDRRCAAQIRKATAEGIRFEVLVAATWRDPHADFCLVVAIFQLKAGCERAIPDQKRLIQTLLPQSISATLSAAQQGIQRLATHAMRRLGLRADAGPAPQL